MGHERVGLLPKSQCWRDIVEDIARFSESNANVPDLVNKTLANVRSRLERIDRDAGVIAAFEFLLALSVSAKFKTSSDLLTDSGIDLLEIPSLFSVAKAIRDHVDKSKKSLEYGQLAQDAAIEATVSWYKQHMTGQTGLFEQPDLAENVWRDLGTGAGFCELARLFFADFTQRHLKYFLEREASAALPSVELRDRFSSQIESHIEAISKHAFETAKITQSFAAGWYNKNTAKGLPSSEAVQPFLAHAFGKLRGELMREFREE